MHCRVPPAIFFFLILFTYVESEAAVTLDGFWELKGTRKGPNDPIIPIQDTPYGYVTFQVHHDGNKVSKYAFDDRGFMFRFENTIQRKENRITELNSEGSIVVVYDIVTLSSTELVVREEGRAREIAVYYRIPKLREISKPHIKQSMDFAFETVLEGGKFRSDTWNYEGIFRGAGSATISCNYFSGEKDLQIIMYESDEIEQNRFTFSSLKHRSATIRLRKVDVSDHSKFLSFRESKNYRITNNPSIFRFVDPAHNLTVEGDRSATVCNGTVVRKKTNLEIQLNCKDPATDIHVRANCQIN